MATRKLTVRIPTDLLDRLATKASAEDRSLNGQVVSMLRKGID